MFSYDFIGLNFTQYSVCPIIKMHSPNIGEAGNSMTAPKSWEHTFHSLDVEPSDLSVGGDVIPLWRAKRNRASLPAWSDFEMMDFRPWLGLVSLDDVSRDLFDCTVRLWERSFPGYMVSMPPVFQPAKDAISVV